MLGIKKLFEFLEDSVQYLHSWLCTKDGQYHMYDIRSVRKAATFLLLDYKENFVEEFKKRFNEGTLVLYEFPFALSKEYGEKLYKVHQRKIKEFDKKYKYEENKN